MAISSIVKPTPLIKHTHVKSLRITALISVRHSFSLIFWVIAQWEPVDLQRRRLSHNTLISPELLSASDLSDCGLVSFPDGVFKMIRSCTDNIHKISLANNQIKALSNKFFITFTQLRGETRSSSELQVSLWTNHH